MADTEISNLVELAGASLADGDPIAIVDASASETKKITAKNFLQSGVSLIDDGSIPAAKVASVGTTQLAAASVTNTELASDAVTTAKIADAAVTNAKVATGIDGAKLSNSSVAATKLGTVTDRGLDQTGGSIGHTNSVAAGTAAGISFDTEGHITGTVAIPSADLPVATASAVGGVSVPSTSGLTVSGAGALDHANSITAGSEQNITFDEHGHITAIQALDAAALPVATTSAKGAVSIPTTGALEVTAAGAVSLSDTAVTPGTYAKVTVDQKGRITSGASLGSADIPDLATSKITSGTFATSIIADDAITAAKLADRSTATIAETTPASGAFIGQQHFNSINGDFLLWDGNVWQPIGISVGEIVLAGTYDASTNLMATVTSEGTSLGFTVGSALPAASASNKGYYVVVSESGTGTSPAPTVALDPPDFILSTGTAYTEVDVSSTVTAQIAGNVAFSAAGNISSTNVQAAIEELDTEKVAAASPTLTGTVTLGQSATLVFEGATDNDYETTLTVADPTGSDKTITLPNTTGTVVTTGDTGTVTSTMISNATIVDADISGSAEIAVSKLANGTARQLLQTDAAGTGVEFTSNVDIPGTLDVAGAVTFDTTLGVTGATTLSSTLAVTGAATFTADATFNSDIIFEGSTADAFETTLTVTDPTADRTITLPDATTTVAGLGVIQSFTKAQRGTVVALTDGATITPDFSAGNNFSVTLGGNRTLANPTNLTAGQSGVIVVTQDGTGSRTLAFGSEYKFAGGTAPTLTTTASAVDVLAYYAESATRITVTAILNVS